MPAKRELYVILFRVSSFIIQHVDCSLSNYSELPEASPSAKPTFPRLSFHSNVKTQYLTELPIPQLRIGLAEVVPVVKGRLLR